VQELKFRKKMSIFKYKRLGAMVGFNHFIAVLILLLIGCSGSPQLIEREIKVPYEIAVHDTILLQDTVINQDTLWSGEVVDSLNNVIGWMKVFYKKKIAELKISKKDTIAIIDTVFIPQNQNIVPALVSALTWWEQLILYGGIGVIISLLIVLRIKRGKL
jgi:hypothetical protein